MFVSIFAIQSPALIWTLRAIFIILWISFIYSSLLISFVNSATSRKLYLASSIWLGLSAYLFISSFLYSIAFALSNIFSPGSNPSSFGIFLICISAVLTIYGMIHAKHIYKKEISITIPNLPLSWKNRTAVFVSDLHLGQIRGKAFAKKIADMIKSLHPNIVFIGGDLYDGVKVDVEDIIFPLSTIGAPFGTYFITGNHEEFRSSDRFTDAIRGAGIHVLANEAVNLDGLRIIGVNDKDSTKTKRFEDNLAGLDIDDGEPSILLKHRPDLLSIAEKHSISLQLSGHTHRAQIFPLNFITKWIYRRYDYGLHSYGKMQVYTSSGAGTWGPPLRVGTRAEIVKITFI